MVMNSKYHFGLFLLIGFLLIVLGFFVPILSQIIISIGTTIFSIGAVAIIWILILGSEPLDLLTERLAKIYPILSKGIEDIYLRRADFNLDKIHSMVARSKDVFILARYFQAFNVQRVQETFRRVLSNGGKIKILIYSPTGGDAHITNLRMYAESEINPDLGDEKIKETLAHFEKFKNDLPNDHKQRFEYRTIEAKVMYVGLIGTEDVVWVTQFLNQLPGDSCPGFVFKRLVYEEEDIYSVYRGEFYRLWNSASEPR